MPLLDAAAILAAEDFETRTVPVPEWGKDAEVLIGSMGALDYAGLQDWIETLGKIPGPAAEPKEDEAEELVTCDDPQPAVDGQGMSPARVLALEQMLGRFIACARAEQMPDSEIIAGLIEEAEQVLSGEAKPAKEFSWLENTEVVVHWCAASILDPKTKQRAFTDDQVRVLGAKSDSALRRIYEAALDLNLSTRRARRDAEKNSVRTTASGSGCD